MAANTKENWLKEEEVHSACDTIRARGERVSTTSIYEELGQRGGFQTIQKFLKTWEDNHSADLGEIKNLPVSAEVPEAIKDLGNNIIKTFWTEAKNRAQADLDSQREAFRQAEAAMNLKVDDVAAFSEQQSLTIDVIRQQIADIQNLFNNEKIVNSELNELIILKKDELTEAEKARDIANSEIKHLTEQLKKIEDNSQTVKLASNAEIKALRDTIDDLNKTHEEALEAAKNAAFTEIKQLTEQVGKACGKNDIDAVEIVNLKEQIKRLTAENKSLDHHAHKLQINLDTVIASGLEIKSNLKIALEGEKAANKRADMLAGELNVIKNING